MDPEFVKRQLQLRRDGDEGHYDPPMGGDQEAAVQTVPDEEAQRIASQLQAAAEHGAPGKRAREHPAQPGERAPRADDEPGPRFFRHGQQE